jgi:SET domain-containing protein 6
MIYEYLQGASSRWKPYLDVLPEDFDTLMFWSESELQGLEGSAVVDKVGRDGADATFSEQLIPIIAQHADVFRTGSRSNDALLALCHRMGSTIMSYAFDLEKPDTDGPPKNDEEWEEEDDAALPKGMIPLADMLNADADCNNAKLFYEDNKVVMKTVKAVRAGEELYNDFGPLPRADLLRRYGYVTENYAQYDVVEVSADMIRAAAIRQFRLSEADIESKWRYLDDQGVLDDAYDIARAGSEEGPFPEELRVLVNVLATPKSEFEKLMTKNKLPKPEPSSLARNLLRDVLVRRYALYPADAGTRPMLSGRAAMADQVIRGEKQVIREAFDALTEASTNKKRGADTLEEEAAVIRQPAKR